MIQVAVFGMGGFAALHQRALDRLEAEGACRLVATCDPQPERFAERSAERGLTGRGVRLFDDWRALLDACAGGLDLVTIPTPVPLHAPMHRELVARGIACYLEKPPTLDPAELAQMLAAEADARVPTAVGFNYIIEAPRQALRARLQAGEFGALREVRFFGHWPRPESYYTRNGWAGRRMLEGRLVLDSCLGNAMAHYVHNTLHWAGGPDGWAAPERVRAELYRAHAIESFDTAFVAAALPGGVSLRIAGTHAAAEAHYQYEEVVCEKATLRYVVGDRWHLRWVDGREESGEADRRDLLVENLRAQIAVVAGESPRPPTTLADSEPFVRLHALALVAAGGIAAVETPSVEADGQTWRPIDGIEAALGRFVAEGAFPSETGTAWARPGGVATPADLGRLPAVAAAG